jgi:hypothetical protein
MGRGEDSADPVGSTNKLRHAWQYVFYPQLKYQGTNGLSFLALPNGEGHVLCLDISTYSIGLPAMFKKGNLSARLHRANGQVDEIDKKYGVPLEHAIGYSSGSSLDGGMTYSAIALFPWGTNNLAESWFEVHIGKECYWIELPYGFDQNPQDISITNIAGGPPKFDSAMKSLGEHDHVIRWETVQYRLGWIQNHWSLSLMQSNSTHGASEVILYREDNKPWDLFSPRTAMRIVHADGTTTAARCIELRQPEDFMRRNDTFVFGAWDDPTRSWDQLEISVDDKSYRIAIPSSMYKYRHGHASNETTH